MMDHRREPPALRPEPWLVYSQSKQKKSQVFYSLSERRCHARNIPNMRNRSIFGHCQGWLVLLHTTRLNRQETQKDCSLFNPVTMEEVHLPRLPSTVDCIYRCALSSPPRGPDNCVVMFLELCSPKGENVFHFCKPGDKDWTTQRVEPQQADQCWNSSKPHLSCFKNLVSFNGELYVVRSCCQSLLKVQFMVESNYIVSIKLLDLKFKTPERPPWDHFVRSTLMSSSFLVQTSPTELMKVELFYGDRQGINGVNHEDEVLRVEGFEIGVEKVELYKANFQEQEWEHVESLPQDTAIFLGSNHDNVVSYKIPTRRDLDLGGLVRGNTIYFAPTKDGYFYAYDLGERSISVSLACPNAKKRRYSEPDWIVPLGWSSSIADHQRELAVALTDDWEDHGFQVLPNSKQTLLTDNTANTIVGCQWPYNIPIDLLSDIQFRLFGADRCFFRLACKTWNLAFSECISTSSNDEFATKHPFPILIHGGKDGELVHLFNPITSVTNILSLDGSSLEGAVIRCSKHGWLLMSQGSHGHKIFFFNPFTKARINLPIILYKFDGITFSSPPTSLDCLVIGYTVSQQHVVITSIYRGERKWTRYRYGVMSHIIDFKSSFGNPIYHQGLLYFLGKKGDLCIHNFKQSTIKFVKIPTESCSSIRRSYLLECNGKLLSVLIGHLGKFLEVYAFNREIMAWEELYDLEDRMLFLSAASALLVRNSEEKISGLENKVFLDRFKEKHGVFYSLTTKKFHTFWSGYNNDDWCNTKEYINCAWIEPNFNTHTKEELQWLDPAVLVAET